MSRSTNKTRLQERVFQRLHPPDDGISRFDTYILLLIMANMLAFIIEIEGTLYKGNESFFERFEAFSSIVFTVEYVIRVWVAPLDPEYAHLGPVVGRLRYMVSFMALVDLVAVLPFYLSFLQLDLRVVRSFRLIRLLRLAKLLRSDAFRRALFHKLNPDEGTSPIDSFIILLIAASVISVILETEESISAGHHQTFHLFEFFSSAIFTCEYLVRVWIAPLDPRYAHLGRFRGRLRYIVSFVALVDLIAILPFYLSFIKMDLRIARAVRLMRLVRVLKIGRYAQAVKTITRTFSRKREELAISAFVFLVLFILCSSAMYFTERGSQPEAFQSIPTTMWWAVVTLTSVGYGDVTPITPLGRLVGAIISIIGVLLVALPTSILTSGFAEEIRQRRRDKAPEVYRCCPCCGEKLIPFEN